MMNSLAGQSIVAESAFRGLNPALRKNTVAMLGKVSHRLRSVQVPLIATVAARKSRAMTLR
jgi:hypothetical protein